MSGHVGGHPVDMLVDTGSAVTFVHCRVSEKAKMDFKLGMVSEPVVSANGQPLDIKGKCELEIFLDGVSVVHSVLVAQDCLLGIDFLSKHDCTIDLKGKSIKIGKEVMSLKGKNESSKVFRIHLAETVVVPGRHEMILPAKFKGDVCGGGVLGMVEPSPGFAEQHDLLLARVLAQPKDDMVPVRVINPSPAPVTLYQNTSVGIFSQLGDDALEPASCNRLATKKLRQTKPLVLEQFNLDAMNLSSPQRKELASLLDEFGDIFSPGTADLGRTGIVQHRINTGDHPPIKQAPRRVPMHQQGTVRQHVDDMLQHGVVQPSSSPWAASIVLVKKKDSTTHFCVDYRKLNDVTKKDAYPLPRIHETLDALAGA